jgi:hypothetical protein
VVLIRLSASGFADSPSQVLQCFFEGMTMMAVSTPTSEEKG